MLWWYGILAVSVVLNSGFGALLVVLGWRGIAAIERTPEEALSALLGGIEALRGRTFWVTRDGRVRMVRRGTVRLELRDRDVAELLDYAARHGASLDALLETLPRTARGEALRERLRQRYG